MPSEARLKFFLKNIKKGPKIHCLALKLYTGPPNCITGASKSWGGGGPSPRAPPPGSASDSGRPNLTNNLIDFQMPNIPGLVITIAKLTAVQAYGETKVKGD